MTIDRRRPRRQSIVKSNLALPMNRQNRLRRFKRCFCVWRSRDVIGAGVCPPGGALGCPVGESAADDQFVSGGVEKQGLTRLEYYTIDKTSSISFNTFTSDLPTSEDKLSESSFFMIDFNGDWDEPDVWSTPTPSPLSAEHDDDSSDAIDDLSDLKSQKPNENQPSSSSSIRNPPDLGDASFQPIEDHTIVNSNSDPEPSTPKALQSPLKLQSYLESTVLSSDLELPPSDSKFTTLPLVSGSWPTDEAFSDDGGFDHSPSSGFDDFDSREGFKNEQSNEDDEFGDFDDGEMTVGDDNFGGFTASVPLPPTLPAVPVVPFKLPDQCDESTLRAAIEPALDALFTDDKADSSQAWLASPPPAQKKRNEQRSTTESRQPPSILKSDDLQRTWRTLVDGGNGLGRPVEWKRSQIRRFHLVHLGIPVDLNDFLAPPPLAGKLLSIDTKRASRNANGQTNCLSPTVLSPYHGLILDQKRCQELIGLSEASLATQSAEQLSSIRDELEVLGRRASEMLVYKQQKRDRSIQDCKSYNTMISDLVLAAQKIQMASPGSTKRASSINLGSSSISSSSSKWPSLARSNSHQNKQHATHLTTSPPPMTDPSASKSN
ncbi:hypothetical protein PCANC_23626 [Puccinia coronata f. sp. avenae]|uniref:Uncharacterized protein n=1 Tax=Puccinia coronata f. sp. avenae TaxID=200324 RepID=A0A2N5SD06_9BASI|nr:hypothetical protein PCANC_23626 [Puccinia coronata f. sp. avenae]